MYHTALALYPTPSTYNNLGVLIASLSFPEEQTSPRVGSNDITDIIKDYYVRGLALDDRHPHLLTNLGSLLKDVGSLEEGNMFVDNILSYGSDADP